jgi:hypothetical protein
MITERTIIRNQLNKIINSFGLAKNKDEIKTKHILITKLFQTLERFSNDNK